MYNYSKLSYQLKREIKTFSSKISELNMIVVHGFGETPMMLISNIKSSDKRLPVVITKVYLMRWRIEEYYRFKK